MEDNLTSLTAIVLMAGLQNEQGLAPNDRFEGQAAGVLRDHGGSDSDEESESEFSDECNSIDAGDTMIPVQGYSLPSVFFSTIIHRDADNLSRRTLSVDTSNDSRLETQQRTLSIDSTDDRHDGTQLLNETEGSGPPTPWRTSRAKKRIINELKNTTSDIHLHVGQYTENDFGKVNFR